MGLLPIAAPWLFRFNRGGAEIRVPVILGIGAIGYSMLTRYELGAYPLIDMPIHLMLDGASGLFLAASPWLFGFADHGLDSPRRLRPARGGRDTHDGDATGLRGTDNRRDVSVNRGRARPAGVAASGTVRGLRRTTPSSCLRPPSPPAPAGEGDEDRRHTGVRLCGTGRVGQ